MKKKKEKAVVVEKNSKKTIKNRTKNEFFIKLL